MKILEEALKMIVVMALLASPLVLFPAIGFVLEMIELEIRWRCKRRQR